MNRRAGMAFAGALLALSLWSLTAYSADDDEDKQAIKDAQQAVLKLMDSMNGNKGDAKAQAQAIKKKFEELKPVMWVYKPRNKGGIGMKDGASIETEINRLTSAKIRLDKNKVAKMRDDLIKAGELSRAMAEVTDLYAKQYGKKDEGEWKKYTQDMRKGAEELIEAAKSGDPVRVKKAASNLAGSCTDCHTKFRND
jgi:hypothetical protein